MRLRGPRRKPCLLRPSLRFSCTDSGSDGSMESDGFKAVSGVTSERFLNVSASSLAMAHRPPRLAHFSVTCPVSLCARRIVHTVCALAQVTISLKNALSEAFEAGTGVCGARLFDDV